MKPNYEKPQESMKPLKIKKKEDYFDKNDDHICIYDIECPIFFGHTIGSALKKNYFNFYRRYKHCSYKNKRSSACF